MDYEIHTYRAHADGQWYARAALRVPGAESAFETGPHPAEESAEAVAQAWVDGKLEAAGVGPLDAA